MEEDLSRRLLWLHKHRARKLRESSSHRRRRKKGSKVDKLYRLRGEDVAWNLNRMREVGRWFDG